MEQPDGFGEFVALRSRALLRSAWLLTGDWQAAEDLVQTALVKTWPRWHQITRTDRPEVYVRRVMLTTFLSWRKRRWSGEVPVAELAEVASGAAIAGDVDLRRDLVAALRTLPARQRAVVVLRYFDDLTEVDTAAVLGCATGTVKAHHARAMAKLRTVPSLADYLDQEASR